VFNHVVLDNFRIIGYIISYLGTTQTGAAMNNHPRTEPFEPLRKWYPYLWTWVTTAERDRRPIEPVTPSEPFGLLDEESLNELTSDNHLIKDLGDSLAALTKRLAPSKRRPTPRLKQFALWDAALELQARRSEVPMSASQLTETLRSLCTETHSLSDLLHPCDPETRIERELKLGCCIVGKQPQFNVNVPEEAMEELRNLKLDAKDIFILRNSILALTFHSPEDIAATIGVSRQTVWSRGKSVREKIEELRSRTSFRDLAPIAERYRRFPVGGDGEPVVEPWNVVYDTRDTAVGYLTSPASGVFPTYRDLWQILFYLSSAEEGPTYQWELSPGFMWGQEGLHRFVGFESHLFVQDLAPGDYDEENKPPEEPTTKQQKRVPK